jgi:hypothetical protein
VAEIFIWLQLLVLALKVVLVIVRQLRRFILLVMLLDGELNMMLYQRVLMHVKGVCSEMLKFNVVVNSIEIDISVVASELT